MSFSTTLSLKKLINRTTGRSIPINISNQNPYHFLIATFLHSSILKDPIGSRHHCSWNIDQKTLRFESIPIILTRQITT